MKRIAIFGGVIIALCLIALAIQVAKQSQDWAPLMVNLMMVALVTAFASGLVSVKQPAPLRHVAVWFLILVFLLVIKQDFVQNVLQAKGQPPLVIMTLMVFIDIMSWFICGVILANIVRTIIPPRNI